MGMMIVGVDPGFGGGVAFYNGSDLEVHDMPIFKNPKGKTELNLHALGSLLVPRSERNIAVVEQVAAMTKQGVSSVFRFGQGYGALQMALTGHGYEIHYVTPAVWKKHFRLSPDKGVSRSLASQRFPAQAKAFERVKDDGRAEAALIALYGAEKLVLTGVV